MKDFFNKFNREDKDPTPGDDNALKWLDGSRIASSGHAGAKAADFIKKIPYKDKPKVNEVCLDKDVIEFSELGTAATDGDMNAALKLEIVDDAVAKTKVGV